MVVKVPPLGSQRKPRPNDPVLSAYCPTIWPLLLMPIRMVWVAKG